VNLYNPLGKIPVLIMDDGQSLYDSSVIADYLDQSSPLSNLIPQETKLKYQVKRWEALADGVCDAGVAVLYESRRPENLQDPSFVVKQTEKVSRGLKVLNDDLGKSQFCVAETFSLADIALGCSLEFLQRRFPEIGLEKNYPNLARLYASLILRHSFIETSPPSV
jgi:glutathione S-transferase